MSTSTEGSTSRTTRAVTVAGEFLDIDLGPVTRLVPFSIRNGRLEDAKSLLVRPTISACWHWRRIQGLDPMDSLSVMSAYVRMYFAQLTLTAPAGYSAEQIRKAALILGVGRAVTTALYEIDAADLIVGESADPWLTATRSTEGVLTVTHLPSVPQETRTALSAPFVMTDADRAAVAVIHMSAVGILPLQGYSLSVCAHHYLSDPGTQSYKAYEVVEKSHWTSTQTGQWFQTDVDKIRDVIWHKVGHPVSMLVKRRLAYSNTIPKMLTEAGAGSAASRLPAVEPELRAAGSYSTLFQTVRPLLEYYGGRVDYAVLELAMRTVHLYPPENPSMVVDVDHEKGVPSVVVSRMTALKWLGTLMEKNRDMASLCYGFYCALSEANAMLSAGTAIDTLKTSFSLAKLRSQSYASFVAGQQAYGDYTSARNAMRAKGDYIAPGLTFNL